MEEIKKYRGNGEINFARLGPFAVICFYHRMEECTNRLTTLDLISVCNKVVLVDIDI